MLLINTLIHIWIMFHKDYSVQLFEETMEPFRRMKPFMCDLVLQVFRCVKSFIHCSFLSVSASRDESRKDRQTMPHVSPSEPWPIDGLGLSPAPCTL